MDGDLCCHDDVCDFLLGFYDDVTTNNTRTKTVRSPYKPYEAYVTQHKHPYKARTRKILQCNYFITIKDHSHLQDLRVFISAFPSSSFEWGHVHFGLPGVLGSGCKFPCAAVHLFKASARRSCSTLMAGLEHLDQDLLDQARVFGICLKKFPLLSCACRRIARCRKWK